MVNISGLAALDTWLDEQDGFEDGHLAQVERSPGGAVMLRLERYVRLGFRPGDVAVVEVYELVADAPVEFEAPVSHDPEYVLEGVYTADLDGRMVILDLWPGRLRLVADEVSVRHVATERRLFLPGDLGSTVPQWNGPAGVVR